MNIEVWKSDQNQEEIHHFLEGEQNTYVFGINAKLLGTATYAIVMLFINHRLKELGKLKL